MSSEPEEAIVRHGVGQVSNTETADANDPASDNKVSAVSAPMLSQTGLSC